METWKTAKQRFTSEETNRKLREADVFVGQGKTVTDACRQLEGTDKTYFRWCKSHGGLRIDQAKRMRELESENPIVGACPDVPIRLERTPASET